jgi:hypothetical protein
MSGAGSQLPDFTAIQRAPVCYGPTTAMSALGHVWKFRGATLPLKADILTIRSLPSCVVANMPSYDQRS